MADPVSTLNVKVASDVSGLANLNSGIARVRGFRSAVDGLDASLGRMGGTAATAGGGFTGLIAGVETGIGGLLRMTGVAAVASSALGSLFALGKGFRLASDMEQAEVALTTMTGSAATAKSVLKDLADFGAATPFQLPELVAASKQLIAFGEPVKNLMGDLTTLGDIASGVGIPIGQIAGTFGKVMVAGKLTGETLKQLQEAGVPVAAALAKGFHTTQASIGAMVEAGQVGFGQLRQALASMDGPGGQFSGMMAKQSRTVAGLMSTLADSVDMTLARIATTIIDTFHIREAISGLTVALDRVGSIIGTGLDATRPVFDRLRVVAGGAFTAIYAVARPMIGRLSAAWGAATTFIAAHGAAVADALLTVGGVVLAVGLPVVLGTVASATIALGGAFARLVGLSAPPLIALTGLVSRSTGLARLAFAGLSKASGLVGSSLRLLVGPMVLVGRAWTGSIGIIGRSLVGLAGMASAPARTLAMLATPFTAMGRAAVGSVGLVRGVLLGLAGAVTSPLSTIGTVARGSLGLVGGAVRLLGSLLVSPLSLLRVLAPAIRIVGSASVGTVGGIMGALRLLASPITAISGMALGVFGTLGRLLLPLVGFALSPVGAFVLLTGAVVGLAAKFGLLPALGRAVYAGFAKLTDAATSLAGTLETAAVAGFGRLEAIAAPTIARVQEYFTQNWRSMLATAVNVGTAIWTAVSGIFVGLLNTTVAVWSKVGQLIVGAWGLIKSATESASPYLSQMFSRIGFSATGFKDTVVLALDATGYAFRHLGDVARLAGVTVAANVVELGGWVKNTFTVVVPAYVMWFGRMWVNAMTDIGHNTQAVFQNLATNIVSVIAALPALMSGAVKLDQVVGIWKPLTDGFRLTMEEMPRIAAAQTDPLLKALRDQQKALQDSLGSGIADTYRKQQDQAAAAAKSLAEKVNGILSGTKVADLPAPKVTAPDPVPVKPVLDPSSLTLGITPEIKRPKALLVGSAEAFAARYDAANVHPAVAGAGPVPLPQSAIAAAAQMPAPVTTTAASVPTTDPSAAVRAAQAEWQGAAKQARSTDSAGGVQHLADQAAAKAALARLRDAQAARDKAAQPPAVATTPAAPTPSVTPPATGGVAGVAVPPQGRVAAAQAYAALQDAQRAAIAANNPQAKLAAQQRARDAQIAYRAAQHRPPAPAAPNAPSVASTPPVKPAIPQPSSYQRFGRTELTDGAKAGDGVNTVRSGTTGIGAKLTDDMLANLRAAQRDRTPSVGPRVGSPLPPRTAPSLPDSITAWRGSQPAVTDSIAAYRQAHPDAFDRPNRPTSNPPIVDILPPSLTASPAVAAVPPPPPEPKPSSEGVKTVSQEVADRAAAKAQAAQSKSNDLLTQLVANTRNLTSTVVTLP